MVRWWSRVPRAQIHVTCTQIFPRAVFSTRPQHCATQYARPLLVGALCSIRRFWHNTTSQRSIQAGRSQAQQQQQQRRQQEQQLQQHRSSGSGSSCVMSHGPNRCFCAPSGLLAECFQVSMTVMRSCIFEFSSAELISINQLINRVINHLINDSKCMLADLSRDM